jgi:hypothetical protein
MAWPLLNRSQVISTFGADRDHGARHHEGIDIHAPKLTPVVAVADGRVAKVTQVAGTENCCSLVIRHDDGWQSVYVHLNNDIYGTDDGMGIGVRPDLEVGDQVMSGEVIGWVGDSGNAEDTVDHLHFELRTPAGVAVDPAPSLRSARRAADFPEIEPTWPYVDDEVRGLEWVVGRLLTEGLFTPCDEVGLTFCPEEVADPEFVRDIARFLASTEPPPIEGRFQEIQVLEALGDEQRVINEAMGCPTPEPCLDFGITESDLARIAAWVTDRLNDGVTGDPDTAIDPARIGTLPSAEDAVADLKASGLIEACRPPLDNERLLSRERAFNSLVRWVIGPAIDCLEISQRIR